MFFLSYLLGIVFFFFFFFSGLCYFSDACICTLWAFVGNGLCFGPCFSYVPGGVSLSVFADYCLNVFLVECSGVVLNYRLCFCVLLLVIGMHLFDFIAPQIFRI